VKSISTIFVVKFRALSNAAEEPLEFLGAVVCAMPSLFKKRGLRMRDLTYYFDICGVKSLFVVLLISLLMGLVLGFQSAIQLQKMGTDIFIVDLVALAVLKELGPLMTAMIATGRAGSAFAAEIGTMKVNEEISALKTLGLRPEAFLVLPKLVAMLAAMPLLTVFGDAAGVAGGMAVGVFHMGIPSSAYWERMLTVVDFVSVLLGLVKGMVFGILITLAGCYCGFSASGDAQGVGRGTTKAVVLSIFLVVVADAILTVFYSFFGY